MSNTVVNTNVLAINSHRNLKSVGNSQSKASQRLSSGLRINSAADDAAGLAISEKMRAQIRGLDQASTNSQDGISLIQTAEGGMQEIDNMLQRMRELVTQAANDTNDYDSDDRRKIQDEIDSLVEEIDSMKNRVEFNNKKIINGSAQDTDAALIAVKNKAEAYGDYQTAGSSGSILKTTYESSIKSTVDNWSTNIGASSAQTMTGITSAELQTALGSVASLNAYLDNVDSALETLKASSNSNSIDAAAYTDLSKVKEGLLEYRSSLAEKEMYNNQKTALGSMSGNSLYLQVGANASQGIRVSIGSADTKMLGIGSGYGISNINVVKPSGNEISGQLDMLDAALSYVTTQRSKLGATQNRLEYTINSLDISSENLTSAESRIRDTDMAKEMMNLTKSNVLQQAATSMLAQANQAPQNVLQLLQ